MDHSPRNIFAFIRADMREEVFTSNTPWYCVSCYYCMVRCPQDVHITDIMYTLKNMAIDSEFDPAKNGADLARTFVHNVETYGRSFEFGLATRHYLRHQTATLLKKAQMGFGMLTKGRLDLRPDKIQEMDQLKAILGKAKELEAAR
jgi:heterodisulfide reductase subunit C